MPAGLAFEGVGKRYGDVEALRDLTLAIEPGELVVLVGPSGCGKTTALRVAAGLETADRGLVRIGDRDVTSLPPAERNVAMVFQSYALFPHLSVADNIGFGLSARRVPAEEIGRRVEAVARMVGCEDLLERRPHQLSGGERQRVALARALIREPDVYLLDEPLANLDAQLRVDTRAELKALHQRLGNTMLFVTHDQVEALTLGDRVAVLQDGSLQQVGSPDDVYRRPSNRFVAGFIGSPSMNVLSARLDGEGLHAGPFRFEPPRDASLGGRRLEAGVRPEHLFMDETGLETSVEVVEAAGNETFLYVRAGGERLAVRAPASVRPGVGDTVRLRAASGAVYVFDADTGETLWPRP